jgi:hypothetical protein
MREMKNKSSTWNMGMAGLALTCQGMYPHFHGLMLRMSRKQHRLSIRNPFVLQRKLRGICLLSFSSISSTIADVCALKQ